jgi:hypothetical protein
MRAISRDDLFGVTCPSGGGLAPLSAVEGALNADTEALHVRGQLVRGLLRGHTPRTYLLGSTTIGHSAVWYGSAPTEVTPVTLGG